MRPLGINDLVPIRNLFSIPTLGTGLHFLHSILWLGGHVRSHHQYRHHRFPSCKNPDDSALCPSLAFHFALGTTLLHLFHRRVLMPFMRNSRLTMYLIVFSLPFFAMVAARSRQRYCHALFSFLWGSPSTPLAFLHCFSILCLAHCRILPPVSLHRHGKFALYRLPPARLPIDDVWYSF